MPTIETSIWQAPKARVIALACWLGAIRRLDDHAHAYPANDAELLVDAPTLLVESARTN